MTFENRMSDADALMWVIEKDPLLRSTITAVALFDSPPDHDRLVEAVDRCTRLVPRLRQRVVANTFSVAPPRWEVDPNYDPAYHLRFQRLGGEGSLRDVLDVAQPIAMQGFDRARPLWELTIIEGLEDDRTAVLRTLHHAITDGVGGVALAANLFDLEPGGTDRGELPAVPEARVLRQVERVVDASVHESRRALGIASRSWWSVLEGFTAAAGNPRGSVRTLVDTVASVGRVLAPATAPMSDLLIDRSLSVRFDVLRFPVADMKAAAKSADGKHNHAFIAGVLGGLRRYHARHGSSVEQLRMSMPINIRAAGSTSGGNQFTPARFAVPLTIDDPVERMRSVRSLVTAQRAEPALALTQPLAGVLRRLPTSVTTGIFGSMLRGVDVVTSNVPGVPIPVYLAGARMEAQFPFGPMAGAATNITLLSYLDEAQIGVNTDPAAFPDPEVLHECLEEGFAEVLKTG